MSLNLSQTASSPALARLRRVILGGFVVSLTAFLSLITPVVQADEKPSLPNIIFILADDQGYGDVSHAGGLAETPNIDKLAKQGMRFTDAHTTSSVCTPTRYSILTGRYNWRSPLKRSVLFGLDKPLIPTERMTVATFLQKQGYHTGVIGKWHLGLGWQKLPSGETRKAKSGETKGGGWDIDYTKQVDGGPLALGFDESFIIPASLDMFPYVYLKNDVPTEVATVTKAFFRPGPAGEHFEAINCLRDFARESQEYITRSAKEKQPFFLYLPLTSPHTPIVPSAEWQGKSSLGKYGDFVMETDWAVGQVLNALEENKVAENTLVLFSTDNGCSPAAGIPDLIKKGHYPNAHWRGHKADIFEGGHRVPMIVRWPGMVKSESEANQLVSTIDFFATVADIVQAEDDISSQMAEDSFSFLPALLGKAEPTRPALIHHSIDGQFAIRRGQWKLCLCPGSGGWSDPKPKAARANKDLPPIQLFDLTADPGETKNVQAEHSEIVSELVDELAKALHDGRTTPGEKQSNDGWPNTFTKEVLKAYPQLAEEK